jgi:hypothetical protein
MATSLSQLEVDEFVKFIGLNIYAIIEKNIYADWTITKLQKFGQFLTNYYNSHHEYFWYVFETCQSMRDNKHIKEYSDEILKLRKMIRIIIKEKHMDLHPRVVETFESRLTALEAENAELKARVDKLEKN